MFSSDQPSQRWLKLPLDLLNLRSRLLIALCLLQPLRISLDLRVLVRTIKTAHSRDHTKAHEDIGSGQLLPAEERTSTRSSLQLLIQEPEVVVQVAGEESGFHLRRHGTGEGFDEEREGDGRVSDAFLR